MIRGAIRYITNQEKITDSNEARILSIGKIHYEWWPRMHNNHIKTEELPSYSKTHKEPHVDPVCRKKVFAASSFKYELEGTIYHFCSRICREEFSYYPDKYLKRN